MSTTTAPPAIDTEISALNALDFEPVIPCEAELPAWVDHEHAAEWLVRLQCGCTGAVCTAAKDRCLRVNADLASDPQCPVCEACGVHIASVERIGK